jgi:glycosyltransferase involved in cell wall biosynthesis
MKRPEVSVIMSVYNGGRFLRQAIESILNQTFREFELIIVDDGSKDNSPEIVRSYDDPRMSLVCLPNNSGAPAARNAAMQYVKGSFVAAMDADDISCQTRLEKQVAFLHDHPDVVLLGTSASVIDEDGRFIRELKGADCGDDFGSKLAEHNCFAHSSVMLRADVLRQCRGYRAFEVAHDYDLWTRIVPRHRAANLADPLVLYREHRGSLSRRNLWFVAVESSLVRYLYRKRLAGETDELDGVPFAEQQRWLKKHAGLVRAEAREEYRKRLWLLMHELLRRDFRGQALSVCLRGIRAFPQDEGFWKFLYYHGTPQLLRRVAHGLANPRRALASRWRQCRTDSRR